MDRPRRSPALPEPMVSGEDKGQAQQGRGRELGTLGAQRKGLTQLGLRRAWGQGQEGDRHLCYAQWGYPTPPSHT